MNNKMPIAILFMGLILTTRTWAGGKEVNEAKSYQTIKLLSLVDIFLLYQIIYPLTWLPWVGLHRSLLSVLMEQTWDTVQEMESMRLCLFLSTTNQ